MSMYYDPRTGKYFKSSNQVEPFADNDLTTSTEVPNSEQGTSGGASDTGEPFPDGGLYKTLVTDSLNPALPPDTPDYATKYADDGDLEGRPSTPIVFPSKSNLNWPTSGIDDSGISTQSECTWSWDAKCLPRSSNYITDTSNKDIHTPSINIDKPSQGVGGDGMGELNSGDDQLAPRKPANIGEAGVAPPFVFKLAGGTYIYETPGYYRKVAEGSAKPEKFADNTPINSGVTIPDEVAIAITNTTTGARQIPGLRGSELNFSGKEIQAWQMVQNLKRLSTQSKYWADMGRKNAMLYNAKTAIAAAKYGEIEKTNSLLRKQAGSSTGNDGKVERINSSIASQQRQVQIANDATRRRNENIFLLKLLLVYFLVVMIPLVGRRIFGDNFKSGHVVLVIVFISCPFLYILLWNLWSIRNRSPIRWPLRNWDLPLPPDNDEYQEEKPECYPPPACDAACEEELLEIEDEIAADQREIAKCRKTIKQDKDDEFRLEKKLCKFKKKKKLPHTHCFAKTVNF